MNSLSFCLTTPVNSPYLNKCHNCKPNNCFIVSLSENWENVSFSLTEGSWSKLARVITERPTNTIPRILINISPNLESIAIHKLLETIENLSIVNYVTSDSLFFVTALDFSFKPSNFVTGLSPRPKWIVFPPLFTADILKGPSKRTLLVSQNPYGDQAMLLIWNCILLSPNDIYLFLHCLNEICALVQHHHVHHILQTWNSLKTSLCFEFRVFMPFEISSSTNICGINLGIDEVLFVSVSTE